MPKHQSTYYLYRWQTVKELGGLTCQYQRGKEVARFTRYKDLVAYAERAASNAGYAKSAWHEIYDWAQG